MQKLKVIEKDGVRVLTSKQLAESYEAEQIQIQQNFSNNKKRFIEGKHYVLLIGEELKRFKNNLENFEVVAKTVNRLYLWTEKGALLHAKSLNTDKAWEVYDYLVDFYFRVKENQPKEQFPKDKTEKEKASVTFTELSKEDMKRIGMNRGIVMGVYRAEQEKGACDVLDIFNRLSNHGKELAWSLIFGEVRHAE